MPSSSSVRRTERFMQASAICSAHNVSMWTAWPLKTDVGSSFETSWINSPAIQHSPEYLNPVQCRNNQHQALQRTAYPRHTRTIQVAPAGRAVAVATHTTVTRPTECQSYTSPNAPHKLRYVYIKARWSNPYTDLDRPWGSQEVKAPRFHCNRQMKVVSRTNRTSLPPRKYSWYSFLL